MKAPTWYRDKRFIRKKQHHAWSQREIDIAFKMKEEGLSAEKVARSLGGKRKGFTTTKVYNIWRVYKRVSRCFLCRTPLTAEEKKKTRKDQRLFKCDRCKAKIARRKKTKRLKAIKEGICTSCFRRKAIKGRTTCRLCTSYWYRNRIVNGLCGLCGKNPIKKGESACSVCSGSGALRTRNIRKDRKSIGKRYQ